MRLCVSVANFKMHFFQPQNHTDQHRLLPGRPDRPNLAIRFAELSARRADWFSFANVRKGKKHLSVCVCVCPWPILKCISFSHRTTPTSTDFCPVDLTGQIRPSASRNYLPGGPTGFPLRTSAKEKSFCPCASVCVRGQFKIHHSATEPHRPAQTSARST